MAHSTSNPPTNSQRSAAPHGDSHDSGPQPAPFVGRQAATQRLQEQLLSSDARPVCLYGDAGRGKTALADQAAQALAERGAFAHILYTNLSGSPLPEVLRAAMGTALIGPQFNLRSEDAAEQLTAALAETGALLIWDNVEAVFSPDTSSYRPQDSGHLLSLARELADLPGCQLLLISDTSVPPSELTPLGAATIELEPLTAAESSAVLAAYGAPALDEQSTRLGNALALRCAAHYLTDHTPHQLDQTLESLLPGASHNMALNDQQQVLLGIELLLHGLSPDDRLTINALGLYRDGFLEPLALRALQISDTLWRELKTRLAAAGLLTEQNVQGLTIGRLTLAPALQDHLLRRVTSRQRQKLAPRLAQEVRQLWSWLPQGDRRASGLIKRLAPLELANLRGALDLALGINDLILAHELIQTAAPLLALLGFRETLASLQQRHERATRAAIPAEGPLARPAVQYMLWQAEGLLRAGQAEQAATMLQQTIQRITAEKGQSYGPPESALDQGLALRLLASLLKAGGRAEMAIGTLRQATALLAQARSLPQARPAEAQSWRDLAETLMLAKQAEPAEDAVRHGLEIAVELQDLELLGGFENQLAAISVLQGEADQALTHLQGAVEHLSTAQAWPALIATWGQMATLHEAARHDADAALSALAQAIEIAREHELPTLQAQMLVQRAHLSGRQGQVDQSRHDLESAAGLYRKARAAAPLTATLRELAELELHQQRFDQAEAAAEEARQVSERPERGAPWEIYHLLQRIAASRGDSTAATRWRAATQQAFGRSPAAPAVLKRWWPLIKAVSDSCRGAALSAAAAQAIEALETSEVARPMAEAIWSVLGGARGPEVYQALDHAEALVIRTILHGIEHPEMFEQPRTEQRDSSAAPQGDDDRGA